MPTVLLIDDDPSLLDVLALPFEDAGFRVETARDGIAGLAAIRERAPDVVVSDVNMPGLDGFSLCRKLREAHNFVPLLLLTSRDNEIDEALGLELGADDYLAKPFSTRVLLARITALLRREARRGEPSPERPHVVGGYWMGKRVVSPLEALRSQALSRAGHRAAAAPLEVRGQDEITDLADAFNQLLRELEHRQGENERFVADLVHELKNPVAAVRAAAEALDHAPVDETRARRLGKVLLDSSLWAGPMLGQRSALLALIVGALIFARSTFARPKPNSSRAKLVLPFGVLALVQVAMLVQLVALAAPILPERTVFSHGIDHLTDVAR